MKAVGTVWRRAGLLEIACNPCNVADPVLQPASYWKQDRGAGDVNLALRSCMGT